MVHIRKMKILWHYTPYSSSYTPRWCQEPGVLGPFFIFNSWGLFTQNEFGGKIVKSGGQVGSSKRYGHLFTVFSENFNNGQYMADKHNIFSAKQISNNLQNWTHLVITLKLSTIFYIIYNIVRFILSCSFQGGQNKFSSKPPLPPKSTEKFQLSEYSSNSKMKNTNPNAKSSD